MQPFHTLLAVFFLLMRYQVLVASVIERNIIKLVEDTAVETARHLSN
jgi:hypothetical protein